MAQKNIDEPSLGRVKLIKRRKSKNLRLSIASNGDVRVSLPIYASYQSALSYALENHDWITKARQKLSNSQQIIQGTLIGKSYTVLFEAGRNVSKPRHKIKENYVLVTYPSKLSIYHPLVQKSAHNGAAKALKADAEIILPGRLMRLASKHGYSFKSLNFKKLKSRWGSCSSRGDITLNIFLLQLPWHLIDYVLLHELSHTRVLGHTASFWSELNRVLPNTKDLRKELRGYQPNFSIQ